MANMQIVYIGLGSNLSDRQYYIKAALNMLDEVDNIKVVKVSDIIETAPLADVNQPKYLNAVAELKTELSAEELYSRLADIEGTLGRVREEKWSPRTIDLDLLLFGQQTIEQPDLTVPHPQMHLRSFVLKGLCQLNNNIFHSVMKVPVSELANRLQGNDFILDSNRPQLISVTGIIGVGKTTLAKRLSSRLNCKILLEPYDTNPFLPQVYAGKNALALDSQLYFLTGRVEQLNSDTLAPGQLILTDYIFNKELIYARRLLDSQQLSLYEKIYKLMARKITQPVLILYMQDSPQDCLRRIHERNRPYEQRIQLKFLEAINSDYEQLLSNWKTCPVIRISMPENIDLDNLENQIRYYVTIADSKRIPANNI